MMYGKANIVFTRSPTIVGFVSCRHRARSEFKTNVCIWRLLLGYGKSQPFRIQIILGSLRTGSHGQAISVSQQVGSQMAASLQILLPRQSEAQPPSLIEQETTKSLGVSL
ncbi:hypothetical protein O6H91_19G029100 [Diphasiastrum complanatum]|uniref:Uncharacterized protein n=1 Tax=Diphasiastrum complanatum TaxID=34168 RepID=A0ACC2ATT0_DIPCM|nr:hypothetical protein O6H91_19G029100 [Diphasiastrum complanatum]